MAAKPVMREEDTRETRSRRKAWVSPATLDTPKLSGWNTRWVRWNTNGQEDSVHLSNMRIQGYEPVRKEDMPDGFFYDTFNEGKYEGVVRRGDLVLMKIDPEIIRDRTRQMREKTDKLQEAVNSELASKSNQYTPMYKPNIQQYDVVGRKPKFQEED